MIKVGIIGFGYMGHFHYEKMSHFEDVEAVAVFDNNSEKLSEAKECGMRIYDF